MVEVYEFTLLTDTYNKLVLISQEVSKVVAESKIRNGMVTVITKHTTTGVMVNEALECLESDITQFLEKIVPENHPYAHARMLSDYGSTAGNPTGHLKSLVVGNHCHLLLTEGELDKGGAQEIYFCEFDGPAERTIKIQIIGE
ncbi:secondary thiamine-phosphate synthase enzyme [Lachnospiraceae bacterium PF1-21]|uniref:secondary thiamine-phosphate synthase enzyme YjbQ n=1 Tax=Ohessyouella blattaphilus TaxID=2949333 RepID=UPI002568FA65|nr:secondary thiamine-phosphate synthase enzyme YjbQ [Lachnospiraceae bacterium OttesenSCG-928-J05]